MTRFATDETIQTSPVSLVTRAPHLSSYPPFCDSGLGPNRGQAECKKSHFISIYIIREHEVTSCHTPQRYTILNALNGHHQVPFQTITSSAT